MDKRVLKYASLQGLPTPKLVAKWKGYDVYAIEFQPEIIDGLKFYPAIGYPQFILANEKEVRKTTYDEGFEILAILPDEE